MNTNFVKRLISLALIIVTLMSMSTTAFAAKSTSTKGLNVRSGPGSSYSRLGDQIVYGSTFRVCFEAGDSSDWYFVTEINCACGKSTCKAPYEGYIKGDFIDNKTYGHPSNYTTAFGDYIMKKGDRGPRVYNLQRALVLAGTLKGGFAACDGLYGPKTKQAVLDFQKGYQDIAHDGVAGHDTEYRLWFDVTKVSDDLTKHGATF